MRVKSSSIVDRILTNFPHTEEVFVANGVELNEEDLESSVADLCYAYELEISELVAELQEVIDAVDDEADFTDED